MKLPILKSAALLTLVTAGLAFAGPTRVFERQTAAPQCAHETTVAKSLGVINPKTNTPTTVTVAKQYKGCSGMTAQLVCMSTAPVCSHMQ